MHTGPDGHGLDEPVEKAGILELTPLRLILVLPCTLELKITDWTVLGKRQSRTFQLKTN